MIMTWWRKTWTDRSVSNQEGLNSPECVTLRKIQDRMLIVQPSRPEMP